MYTLQQQARVLANQGHSAFEWYALIDGCLVPESQVHGTVVLEQLGYFL